MCLILLRPACRTRQQSPRLQSLGGLLLLGELRLVLTPPHHQLKKCRKLISSSANHFLFVGTRPKPSGLVVFLVSSIKHRLQTDHADEVRAQRTRIRSHVHVSDHGGVSTSNSNSMPQSHQEQHEQLYHLLDTCDFSVLNKFDESYMQPTLIYFVFVSATTVALNKNSQVSLVLTLTPRKTSIVTSCHSST